MQEIGHPVDIFSQLAMAVPVSLLYIISVLVALVVTRRKRAQLDADGDDAPPAEADE